jgi:ribosomal protein L21E
MPKVNKNSIGIRLSEYFKELKPGDTVALVRNLSVKGMFPKQFNGRTGIVVKKLKTAYEVKFLNGKVYRTLLLKPIHLKKINEEPKSQIMPKKAK